MFQCVVTSDSIVTKLHQIFGNTLAVVPYGFVGQVFDKASIRKHEGK